MLKKPNFRVGDLVFDDITDEVLFITAVQPEDYCYYYIRDPEIQDYMSIVDLDGYGSLVQRC